MQGETFVFLDNSRIQIQFQFFFDDHLWTNVLAIYYVILFESIKLLLILNMLWATKKLTSKAISAMAYEQVVSSEAKNDEKRRKKAVVGVELFQQLFVFS